MEIQLTINGQNYTVSKSNGQLNFEDGSITHSLHKVSPDRFLVRIGARLHEVEVSQKGKNEYSVLVNNKKASVEVKDAMQMILENLGMNVKHDVQVSEIRSPMPGTIVKIHVSVGQAVKKGDPLLILEAMKMENIVKSPSSGTVTKLEVEVGQNVEKNQPLIKF